MSRTDVYTKITNQIVEMLEAGVKPWRKPWDCGQFGAVERPLRHSGEPYKGINVLILWLSATSLGYTSPYWMTYRQAKQYGGQVRKGERGTMVVFVKKQERKSTNEETGEEETFTVPIYREYTVFNAGQIDDLADKFHPQPVAIREPTEQLTDVEAFFDRVGAEMVTGSMAAYSPSQDVIMMPPRISFDRLSAYYATMAHEHIHWTRHETRLDRKFDRKRWGDEGYATEELVAEIGSAFLSADLGIEPIEMPQHAAYIENWIKVLKNDKKAIFTASSHAELAVGHLHQAAETEEHQQAARKEVMLGN